MSHQAPNGHGRPPSAHLMPRRASDSSSHHQPTPSRPATAPSHVPTHAAQPRPNGFDEQAQKVSMELLAPLKLQLEQSWQTAVGSVANHLLAAERHKDHHLHVVNNNIQKLQAELQQVKSHNATLEQRDEDLSRSLAQLQQSIRTLQRRAEDAETKVMVLEGTVNHRDNQLHSAMRTLDNATNLADLVQQVVTSRLQDMRIIAARLEDALMKPTLRAVFDSVRDEAFLLTKMSACGSADIRAGKPAYPEDLHVEQLSDDHANVHAYLMQKLPKLDEHFSQLQAGLPAALSTSQKKEAQTKTEEQMKEDEVPPSSTAPPGFKGLPRPANRVRLPSAQGKTTSSLATRPQWLSFTPGHALPDQDILQCALQQKTAITMTKASIHQTRPAKVARSMHSPYDPEEPPFKRVRQTSNAQVTRHPQYKNTTPSTPTQSDIPPLRSGALEADKAAPNSSPIVRSGAQARAAHSLRVVIPQSEPSSQDVSMSRPASRSASHPLTPTPPRPPISIVSEIISPAVNPGDEDDVLSNPVYRDLVGKITVEKLRGLWHDVDNNGILHCRWCLFFAPDDTPGSKGQFPSTATNKDLNDHMLKEHCAVWTTGIRREALQHLSGGAEADLSQDEGQEDEEQENDGDIGMQDAS